MKNVLKWLVIVMVVLVLLFFLSVAVLGRVFKKSMAGVPVPRYVPSGFTRTLPVELGYNKGNKFYLFKYSNKTGKKFMYRVDFIESDNFNCHSTEDYIYVDKFIPTKETSNGCILEGINSEGKSERIYFWLVEKFLFSVFVEDESLEYGDVNQMAENYKIEFRIDNRNDLQIIR